MGTGRRGTVAGKVYLRRTDVIRVVQMLGSHGAAGGQPQPLQPVEAEMDGLEGYVRVCLWFRACLTG